MEGNEGSEADGPDGAEGSDLVDGTVSDCEPDAEADADAENEADPDPDAREYACRRCLNHSLTCFVVRDNRIASSDSVTADGYGSLLNCSLHGME